MSYHGYTLKEKPSMAHVLHFRENKALFLNGSSYGTIGNLSSLGIEKR